MLEPDPVDVMPEFLSNQSPSPEKKEIVTNGAATNGTMKYHFDSIADTIEAFSMISPTHTSFKVLALRKKLQNCP